MKKSLLFIAVAALSMGATAQVVPSPFWTMQNSNYSMTGQGSGYMDVVDANVVWAMNTDGQTTTNFNEFTRTINGGTTYTSGLVYPNLLTNHPASIEGIDANTAWVTSYLEPGGNMGAIHTTTNGGVTWTDMTPVNMYTNTSSFADFSCFFTPTVGITVGDPVGGEFEIHRTTNGGTTWTLIAGSAIPNPSSATEYAITDVYTKLGTTDIWFGTSTGRVYHSNDQGQTWTVGATGSTSQVTVLAFRDAMNGIVYTNAGTAYRTTNGGVLWSQITPIDPNMGRGALCAIPGTNIYASCGSQVGNQILSYSTDDGSTWTSWGSANIPYYEIEFVSNMVGYAGALSDMSNAALDGMWKYSGSPLGINSVSAPVATIEMYPNPTSGIVTLNLSPSKHGGATLSVIDAMGKTVYSENLNNGGFERHTLNLEHLAKGIYSVNIIRPTGLETQKIIIQ